MGKATIVSDQGEGLYTIRKEVAGLAEAIAKIEEQRAKLETLLADIRLNEINKRNIMDARLYDANEVIDDWASGIEIPQENLEWNLPYKIEGNLKDILEIRIRNWEVPEAVMNAVHASEVAKAEWYNVDVTLKRVQAQYLSVLERQNELNSIKEDVDATVQAWCADYTEELTGTVATLEVPGEVDPTIGGGINIRPGYTGSSAWSSSYGQIQIGPVLTPEAFAWNFTMIQPWMKWKPKWRYATVAAKDEEADTLDVTLSSILSNVGSYLDRDTTFNDPWTSSMTGVPVEYMSCGAQAFEVGDEVIVEFRETTQGELTTFDPYVIGFADHPKQCPWPQYLYVRIKTSYGTGAVFSPSDLWDDYQRHDYGQYQTFDEYGRILTSGGFFSETKNEFGNLYRSGSIYVTPYTYSHYYDDSIPLPPIIFGGRGYEAAYEFDLSIDTLPDKFQENTGTSPGYRWEINESAYCDHPHLLYAYYVHTIEGGLITEDGGTGVYYYHSDDISSRIYAAPITVYKDKGTDKEQSKSYNYMKAVFQKIETPQHLEDFDRVWCLDSIETYSEETKDEIWRRRMWLQFELVEE